MMAVKVLIIDTDEIAALSYLDQLKQIAHVKVLGVVSSYLMAVSKLKKERPEFVFCNPKLSEEAEVIDVAVQIRAEFDSKVIVLGKSMRIKEQMDRLFPYVYITDTADVKAYKKVLSTTILD